MNVLNRPVDPLNLLVNQIVGVVFGEIGGVSGHIASGVAAVLDHFF